MKTIYEDSRVLVETNGGGEIFITNKEYSQVQIRVGPQHSGQLLMTSFNGQLVPWAINGLSAILVKGL
jgi:hypothetical protein